MKVVILAGGFGTRLSEETATIPKPLVCIGEMPILWHIMKIYSSFGFNDFVICLGYKGNAIKDFFNKLHLYSSNVTFDYSDGFKMILHNKENLNWKVTLVDTGLNSMTGGRLKRIENYIDSDTFMFTYGDGVSDVNISELVENHISSKKIATVTAVKPIARFGAMSVDQNCSVTKFKEKITESHEWINGGFFVANKEIFNYLDGDDCILEQEPLKKLSADNELNAYKHTGFWHPMDTLKEKNHLENLWNSNKAPWKIW